MQNLFNLKSGNYVSGFRIMNIAISLKKTFILILAVITISSAGICADYVTTKLNEIEKSYYGYTFNGNSESRLSRLEQALYGQTYKNPAKSRVDKIYKDLSLGVNSGSATGAAAPVTTAPAQQNTNIGPKAEAGIKYPVVDKLEQKIFQKAYANDDIYVRLSRLEKKVFKKESTLSLNERVDALRDKLLGGDTAVAADIDPATEEIVLDNGKKYYDNSDFSNFGGDSDSHYNYYSYQNSKNRIQKADSSDSVFDDNYSNFAPGYEQNYDLDILEKQLFGKRFIQEAPAQRLARLENKVFQRTFSDDTEARTQRLLAVTTAQKTSKEYDSNKWAQRLNTGIQIGSILLMVLAMIL